MRGQVASTKPVGQQVTPVCCLMPSPITTPGACMHGRCMALPAVREHLAEGWLGDCSIRRTNNQLLTFPSGSGMKGAVSSCRHFPSTMNLYWWYLHMHAGGVHHGLL